MMLLEFKKCNNKNIIYYDDTFMNLINKINKIDYAKLEQDYTIETKEEILTDLNYIQEIMRHMKCDKNLMNFITPLAHIADDKNQPPKDEDEFYSIASDNDYQEEFFSCIAWQDDGPVEQESFQPISALCESNREIINEEKENMITSILDQRHDQNHNNNKNIFHKIKKPLLVIITGGAVYGGYTYFSKIKKNKLLNNK